MTPAARAIHWKDPVDTLDETVVVPADAALKAFVVRAITAEDPPLAWTLIGSVCSYAHMSSAALASGFRNTALTSAAIFLTSTVSRDLQSDPLVRDTLEECFGAVFAPTFFVNDTFNELRRRVLGGA